MKNIFRLLLLCSLVLALTFLAINQSEARSLTGTYGMTGFQSCTGAHWIDELGGSAYWATSSSKEGIATYNANGTGTITYTEDWMSYPIYTPIPLGSFFSLPPTPPMTVLGGQIQSISYTSNFTYTVDASGNYQSQMTGPLYATITLNLPSNPSSTFYITGPNGGPLTSAGYVMHNDNVIVESTVAGAPESIVVTFTNVPSGWTGGTTMEMFCTSSSTLVKTIK